MKDRIITMGVDVGGSYIKTVLLDYSDKPVVLDTYTEKIRKRDPVEVVDSVIDYLLEKNNLQYEDVDYIASTGEGEMVKRKTGHFYSMTTHARGAKFFHPDVKSVIDMGALYVRAISVDDEGKVSAYKMTGQCASGSGQFIENISRYLGLSIDEVGPVSLEADAPETPSGICAVLAETDVINSVSRGISTPNIIKGIHLSIANRAIRLLSALKAESPVVITGGIGLNEGMMQALRELAKESSMDVEIKTDPNSIFAGAIGAALWGGYRHMKLQKRHQAAAV